MRLGGGPKARLRFRSDRVAEALTARQAGERSRTPNRRLPRVLLGAADAYRPPRVPNCCPFAVAERKMWPEPHKVGRRPRQRARPRHRRSWLRRDPHATRRTGALRPPAARISRCQDREESLMARASTGGVVEKTTSRGTSYALRFRALGKRQFVHVGHQADGVTERTQTVNWSTSSSRSAEGSGSRPSRWSPWRRRVRSRRFTSSRQSGSRP